MVEMLETSQILRGATRNSLVIMDEVGRGTGGVDGVAIAFACLWWLHERVGCRVLFATHFWELADMVHGLHGISFLRTDLIETQDSGGQGEGGGFYFSHKVVEGVNRNAHGLKVASIAGMPKEVLDVAEKTQQSLLAGNSLCDPLASGQIDEPSDAREEQHQS